MPAGSLLGPCVVGVVEGGAGSLLGVDGVPDGVEGAGLLAGGAEGLPA